MQPASLSSPKSLCCLYNDSVSMLLHQDPSCVQLSKQVPPYHITQHSPFSRFTFPLFVLALHKLQSLVVLFDSHGLELCWSCPAEHSALAANRSTLHLRGHIP